jgi:SAM-dependent methyltransferase
VRGSGLPHKVGAALEKRRHRAGLRRLERGKPPDYRAYLEQQLERSLSKRANDPGAGARVLVERTADLAGLASGASVLCVGPRNSIELDLFRSCGISDVVGIDLFSQSPDILVMDMHAMTFADEAFDAVYASHSLEHAHDLDAVLDEIARVSRPGGVLSVEVPVRHRGHDADLIVFDGLEDLQGRVERLAERVLWADEQPAGSETNDQGSAVARLVVAIRSAS